MYFQYGHKSEPPQELALCKAADVQQVLEGREQQGLFLFPGSSAWLPGRHCTAGWSQSASACASSTVLEGRWAPLSSPLLIQELVLSEVLFPLPPGELGSG